MVEEDALFLSSMSVVYVLTTPILEGGGDDTTVEQIKKIAKWDNDDYVCRALILNDFKHTLKHLKEELTLVELGSHLRIEKCLRMQDSNKPKGNNVDGPSVVNMVEHNNSSRNNDNKGVNVGNKANGSSTKDSMDGSSNSLKGQTAHVCKDRYWFKTYELLNDGSILYMGNESTALVHRRGCVDLRLNIVNDNIASAFMSTSKLNNSILWHARLGHVHFKKKQDMSKDGLIPAFEMYTKKCKTCMLTKITKKPFQNVKRKTKVLELIYIGLCDLHATPSLWNKKKYFVTFIDEDFRFSYVYLLHTKDEALYKFKVFKTEVALQQESLIKRLRTDRGGERSIECIFVRYAEHSKAFRFYVIKPYDLVSINSIIESNAIFDENRFSSVPRPSLRIPNRTEDIDGSVVPE
nr:zinc finger, CCHC-type [Tanacetum cinerariifolium]